MANESDQEHHLGRSFSCLPGPPPNRRAAGSGTTSRGTRCMMQTERRKQEKKKKLMEPLHPFLHARRSACGKRDYSLLLLWSASRSSGLYCHFCRYSYKSRRQRHPPRTTKEAEERRTRRAAAMAAAVGDNDNDSHPVSSAAGIESTPLALAEAQQRTTETRSSLADWPLRDGDLPSCERPGCGVTQCRCGYAQGLFGGWPPACLALLLVELPSTSKTTI